MSKDGSESPFTVHVNIDDGALSYSTLIIMYPSFVGDLSLYSPLENIFVISPFIDGEPEVMNASPDVFIVIVTSSFFMYPEDISITVAKKPEDCICADISALLL